TVCAEPCPGPCDLKCPNPRAAACTEPCVIACPDSRVIIFPPPVVVTFPGAILTTYPQETVVGSTESAELAGALESGVAIGSSQKGLECLESCCAPKFLTKCEPVCAPQCAPC
ncbi:KRFA protein, partial [Calyptomena viridis]|nr:KRFA protein [Calyptomena viridis]